MSFSTSILTFANFSATYVRMAMTLHGWWCRSLEERLIWICLQVESAGEALRDTDWMRMISFWSKNVFKTVVEKSGSWYWLVQRQGSRKPWLLQSEQEEKVMALNSEDKCIESQKTIWSIQCTEHVPFIKVVLYDWLKKAEPPLSWTNKNLQIQVMLILA